MIYIAPLS